MSFRSFEYVHLTDIMTLAFEVRLGYSEKVRYGSVTPLLQSKEFTAIISRKEHTFLDYRIPVQSIFEDTVIKEKNGNISDYYRLDECC